MAVVLAGLRAKSNVNRWPVAAGVPPAVEGRHLAAPPHARSANQRHPTLSDGRRRNPASQAQQTFSAIPHSALRTPHSALERLHCTLETVTSVTLLSISNLNRYKSVTHPLQPLHRCHSAT